MEIAIIGMGCRFPGGVYGPDSFWELLRNGVDAVREVPPDRWSARAFFAPAPPKPGKTYSYWGGFLDGIDMFDAAFFGISPREAASTDPQQRMLLEVAWDAVEDAGLTQEWLAGRQVSVFVGASSNDYLQLQADRQSDRKINAYTNAGGALSIIANRLSYVFDLRGPSLTVDTACSSSLVAFHYACESLRRGESEAAIVGGVNLLLWPSGFIGFSQAHMLSPEGRCRSFDAAGNGYVRAEGAAAVVLKPLRRALADNDPIQAIIRATGVNQDGRTPGMSVPNEESQAALLREVYSRGNIDPRNVSYIEAHGTGTSVGDPIEARAIGRVLGLGRTDQDKLRIGSVKSNIGHLEPASGMAGVIKTVLALQRRELPANLHFETPNPAIDFENLHLRVVTKRESWQPINGSPLIAGVNSFGFGGTNAHLVLAEAPAGSRRVDSDLPRDDQRKIVFGADNGPTDLEEPMPITRLVPLSAKSEAGLKAVADAWIRWLNGMAPADRPDIDQLAFTAAVRRTHHQHRLAITTASTEQLCSLLESWQSGEKRREVSSGSEGQSQRPKTAFVFNGMGSQWQGMGQELMQTVPVFRDAIEQLDAIFQRLSGWSIVSRLSDDEFRTRIDEAEVTQPCIFAVQVGLTALWRNWGIEPDSVVGHSVGEVAAAHVAGVLSLEDAVRVIYHRSRLQHRLRGRGRMLAVGVPSDSAEQLITRFDGKVSIAAVNSPSSVTLSGDAEALEDLQQELEASQAFCRFLKVDVPYHSDRMEAIRDELRDSLAGIESRPPKITYFSTVTGGPVVDPQLDAEYWWKNVRQPVLFAPAMHSLLDAGTGLIVEVGSHPVLMNSIAECADGTDKMTALPSMRRAEPQLPAMHAALGRLFTLGFSVRFDRVYPEKRTVIRLPSYGWQRESFWSEEDSLRQTRLGLGGGSGEVLGSTSHPLLGQSMRSAHQERAWQVSLSIDADHLWINDHQMQGTCLFPGAGFIEQGLAAGRELYPDQPLGFESIEVSKALVLTASRQATVETVVDPLSGDLHIDSYDEQAGWTRHFWGKIRTDFANWNETVEQLHDFETACSTTRDVTRLYEWFASIGMDYGPNFQAIDSYRTAPGVALGQLRMPAALLADSERMIFCPSMLDACFQLLLAAPRQLDVAESAVQLPDLYLPSKVSLMRVHDPAALSIASREGLSVGCRVLEKTETLLRGDAIVFDRSGRIVVVLQGLEATAFPVARQDAFRLEDCLLDHRWEMRPRPGESFAVGMPEPQALAVRISSRIASLREECGQNQIYRELQPMCEKQAAAFAANALRKLGCPWIVGQKATIAELAQKLGIHPDRDSLFRNVLQRLALNGKLRVSGEIVEYLEALPEEDHVRKLWQQISRRWPAAHAEQLLAWRAGNGLDGVLTGEIDPQDARIDGGFIGLIEQAEEDGPSFRIQNRMLQESFIELVKQLPPERPIRVLEVGGGPGAAAMFVLPTLPSNRTDYVFTDVSEEPLAAIGQKLREYSFVNCTKLDPAADAIEQGFQPYSFDILICADDVPLNHLVRLLAPGGLMVLRCGFVGARHGTGTDGLSWHALRLRERTRSSRQLLESLGLEHITEISDAEADEQTNHALWLGNAPFSAVKTDSVATTSETSVASSEPGTWWLVTEEAGDAAPLAQRMSQMGGRPVLISPALEFRKVDACHYELPFGDVAAFQHLCQSAITDGVAPQSIVHLIGLNAPVGDEVSLDELRSHQTFGSNTALALVQATAQAEWTNSPRVWFITRNVQSVGLPSNSPLCLSSAPVWGLARVLTNEVPHLKCTTIDLSPTNDTAETDSLFRELAANGDELEVVLRGRNRYVPRLTQGAVPAAASDPSDTFRVMVTARGSLDSIRLCSTKRKTPAAGEVEIQVVASAVNFKDVAKSLHMLSDETLADTWSGDTLGLECAGRITAIGEGVVGMKVGDRVLALAADCFRPYVVTRAEFVAKCPDHLSLEDAAGIPVVFLTAWYALHQLAHVSAGERVLIHAAAGGVGLAAIQIAQAAGAEVFATAGSTLKRDFLRAQGVKHVFDSRSLSFVDDIRGVTDGLGVDVVLNSLSGAAIPASLSLLRAGGRFVEIGKRDIQDNVGLGLRPFHNNLAFFALDLDRLLAQRPDMARSLLEKVLNLFRDGSLVPIPCRTFGVSRAADALRYVAKARQIGKVVLDMRDPIAPTRVQPAPVETSTNFAADGTYLISGGLSGFGLATAKWLIRHGAKQLVLLSRRGASTLEVQQDVLELELSGARVQAMAVDVANEKQLAAALETIRRTSPPLKGVFHAAMVLDDVMAAQLTPERMEKVLAPKAWGAWNLHKLTREDPLEHFVLYSSATTVFGNPSQANYVAACIFLDRLARHRHAMGRPALSVAWGAIADVGYLSRNQDVLKHIEERLGFRPLAVENLLTSLGQLMTTDRAQAAVVAVDWSRFSPSKFAVAASPRMETLAKQLGGKSAEANASAGRFRETLAAASPDERPKLLCQFLAKSLAAVLGTSEASIETNRSLLAMGLDSLMAVELQMGLSRELECKISPMQLLRGPSLEELTDELLAQFAEAA